MKARLRRRGTLGAFVLVAVLGLALVAAACGDDDDDDDDDDDGTPVATQTVAPDADTATPGGDDDADDGADSGATEFDMSMGDNFFEPEEIAVPAGEEVTVNLVNDGSAIHNMRIAGADGEYDTDDDVVSDPDLMRGGDEGTIVFTLDEAGTFDFRCDFHPTDMTGTITVE